MAQTIDLLKNSSFEQGIADLVSAIQTQSSQYTLPIASSTTLGGVKVGEGLSIDNNGTLTANASGTSESDAYIATSVDGKTLKIKSQASESEVTTVIDSIYARLDAVEGSIVGIVYSEEEPTSYAVGTTWIDG